MCKSTTSNTTGKSGPVRIPALARIAARLESMMEAVRKFGWAAVEVKDAQLALDSLLLACHDVLDALDRIGGRASLEDMADAATALRMDSLMAELVAELPPVRGGGPDDYEVIDPEFVTDPQGWPSDWDEDLDGYRWVPTFDGPTPDDVLAASAPTWEPSPQDWAEMYAMSDASLTEADHVAACGMV